jgi:hypothetical protein
MKMDIFRNVQNGIARGLFFPRFLCHPFFGGFKFILLRVSHINASYFYFVYVVSTDYYATDY